MPTPPMSYRNLTIKVGNVDKIDHSLATLHDLMQRVTLSAMESQTVIDVCSILQALKNAASVSHPLVRSDSFTVQSICFAYEQGVGQCERGLVNPFPPNTHEHAAYAWGVEEGKQQIAIKAKEEENTKANLAAMSKLVALRPLARELKHQRVTEEEYHALPPAVKAYFTLVDEGQEPPGECESYPLDGIKPVSVEEYLKKHPERAPLFARSAVDALSVQGGGWTWSVPVDESDTVRGSTEDGWAATVMLVNGASWEVTITLKEGVARKTVDNRAAGVRYAESLRRSKQYTPPDVGCVRCGLLVCECAAEAKS